MNATAIAETLGCRKPSTVALPATMLRQGGGDMAMMANMVGPLVRKLSTFNNAGTCDPVPNGRLRAQARGPP